MTAPRRVRLSAELAPDAPQWWKERVAPLLQQGLGDAQALLDGGLTLGENLACCLNTVRVVMPETQPDTRAYARARRITSVQTIPNTTTTVVAFNSTDIDSRTAVTGSGTTSWRFTAPTGMGGIYLVAAHIGMDPGGAAGSVALNLFHGGNWHSTLGVSITPAAAVAQYIGGSTLVQLAAGDYIDVRVYQACGGNRNIGTTGQDNHVSIHQVSDPTRQTPSCFPIPFRAQLQGRPFRPRVLVVGDIRDAGGGPAVLSGPLGSPVWDYDGKEFVKLLDLPGLSYGRSYDVTLAAFAG